MSPTSRRWRPPTEVAVRAPLKLVLAGEYAVLEPGSSGVVAAVDRHVTCRARLETDGVAIRAPALGTEEARAPAPGKSGEVRFEHGAGRGARRFLFARAAAEIAYRYVAELGFDPCPLALECESQEGLVSQPGEGRAKLGLGTSAATTVAAIGAILGAHGVAIDRAVFRRHVFRLALFAHARAQGGHGSGIDIAASVHGGLLEYGQADAGWLRWLERESASDREPEEGGAWRRPLDRPQAGALDVARAAWPGLRVEPLRFPRGIRLLVGFTGASAATADLVVRVETWKRESPAEHETFVRLSHRATRSLAAGLLKGDRDAIVANVALARKALAFLGSRAEIEVETPALARLADIAFDAGGAGKLSGAGGGDCGFALAFDDESARRIERGWREAGITPVPLGLAASGCHEVREEAAR